MPPPCVETGTEPCGMPASLKLIVVSAIVASDVSKRVPPEEMSSPAP